MECLGRSVTRGMTLTAIADDLGLRKQDYARLRGLLAELVGAERVATVPGGGFSLAAHGRAADPKARAPRRAAPPIEAAPVAAPPVKPPRPPAKLRRSTRPLVAPPVAPPIAEDPAPAPRARLPWGGAPAAKAVDPAPSPATAPKLDPSTVGRITVHPAGYGFVSLDDGNDVFVPAKFRGHSLDGDRVVVVTWQGYKGTEGRVESVVARGRARLTGTFRRGGRLVWLEPDDPRIAADHGRVTVDGAAQGQDGDAVVVEITRYPTAAGGELAGRIVKVLGDPDDPRTEIEKILAIAAIPQEWPELATAQAKATHQELGDADLADRIDLRDRRFATIDPETARDFDDALCVEDGPRGGTRVWVAVADVSHYVRWDDALDREAVLRGVSVYLPDRVIPMLPHELSSGICSLNADVDRCAMVVRLDYDATGERIDTSYAAAVIRSKARLDYPGVAAALGGDFRGRREAYRPWADELARLDGLARILRAKRRARGALELEIPEAKVVLDADDPRLIRDVVKSKGDPAVKQAYELVEEFMIAANEAVGKFFRERGAPTVWRVHAPPKAERVRVLAEMLAPMGITVDAEEAVTPIGMKNVLDQILEKPSARSLSFLVLRTLKQAIWDTVPVGHFGLASMEYLHFTSPIRRYPDLLVHRLLKYYLAKDGQPSGGGYRKPPPVVERLTELAAASSQHERRAMEAEREAVAMYRAYLMRDQVGERYTGAISAVTSFGAFVEIDEPFVEGLLKLDALGEDMVFDEIHLTLRARRSGLTLSLGDPVTVEIVDVSVPKRRINLALVQGGKVVQAPAEDPVPPRIGLLQRKAAGRAVEKAALGAVEKGAPRRKGGLSLKVSHRGPGESKRGKPSRKRR